tara:strand:+ start:215 stop:646 length:432 start_codon:yes stop_codon:yes gene_type:complete
MNKVAIINLILIFYGLNLKSEYIDLEFGLGLFSNLLIHFLVPTLNVIFLNTFVRNFLGMDIIEGSQVNQDTGALYDLEYVAGFQLWGLNIIYCLFLGFAVYSVFYEGLKSASNHDFFYIYSLFVSLLTIINFHVSWKQCLKEK